MTKHDSIANSSDEQDSFIGRMCMLHLRMGVAGVQSYARSLDLSRVTPGTGSGAAGGLSTTVGVDASSKT